MKGLNGLQPLSLKHVFWTVLKTEQNNPHSNLGSKSVAKNQHSHFGIIPVLTSASTLQYLPTGRCFTSSRPTQSLPLTRPLTFPLRITCHKRPTFEQGILRQGEATIYIRRQQQPHGEPPPHASSSRPAPPHPRFLWYSFRTVRQLE